MDAWLLDDSGQLKAEYAKPGAAAPLNAEVKQP